MDLKWNTSKCGLGCFQVLLRCSFPLNRRLKYINVKIERAGHECHNLT